MARITKADTNRAENIEVISRDEMRRFITHADDMIEAQKSVTEELKVARAALEKAAVSYDRTSHALARREAEGIKIELSSDIEKARKKIAQSLLEPIVLAETISQRMNKTTFLAAAAGSAIGGSAVLLFLIFT